MSEDAADSAETTQNLCQTVLTKPLQQLIPRGLDAEHFFIAKRNSEVALRLASSQPPLLAVDVTLGNPKKRLRQGHNDNVRLRRRRRRGHRHAISKSIRFSKLALKSLFAGSRNLLM